MTKDKYRANICNEISCAKSLVQLSYCNYPASQPTSQLAMPTDRRETEKLDDR